MDDINSVILIGRLTSDPNLRFIAGSGRAVCNYTIAVDKGLSKDKKEEMQAKGTPTADFIRVVVWGKQAENCASFLTKGRLVGVNGSIQTRNYKDNKGETRYSTEVLASRVEFLEWGDKQQSSGDNFNYGIDPSEFQAIEDDDDIPF